MKKYKDRLSRFNEELLTDVTIAVALLFLCERRPIGSRAKLDIEEVTEEEGSKCKKRQDHDITSL
ncbi:hypothetical protein [Alkalihalobacillus pseudalcaliphilus]|uniref:hypothetical protein n=1 Tax=Alkalihalobacillus pseudalcaliphilus TaxID=79884 RepID=UPI00064DEDD0|nr:hypothetical protein [Alkalihalobacillus pseudalcaliphilus]KMK77771.1 hypothetical protein AB990_04785 [Alkalihalobacillus pseudalcaliphilus]